MSAKFIAIRLTAALILVAGVALAQPAAAQKIPVRAAYVPVVTWLSSWVAKEEGYFDEQGLDVSFIVVQNISMVPGTVGKNIALVRGRGGKHRDIAPAPVVDLIKAAGGGLSVFAVAGNHWDAPGA